MSKLYLFTLSSLLFNVSVNAMETDKQELDQRLLLASKDGELELVKSYVLQGANLEFKNSLGQTPLYFAIRNEHTEVAEYLLSCGANPKVVDANGSTPFDGKALVNLIKLINLYRLFLRHGVRVEDLHKKDDCALNVAVRHNSPELAQL
ncbi:MAG TPA: ankyrin repeat domain-containing protein, partial [Candidatus Babeliaceae bacterium]|nr:ankyrin repeat domain-containing protein [Candidatus Babeliaceae bacterium]